MGRPRLPVAAKTAPPVLASRHLRVLSAAAEGFTYKQTAEQFHISPETVKVYRKEAIMICNARNTTHAVVIAMRNGWL